MNNTGTFTPEEKLVALYGRKPPVQALGRLIAERSMAGSAFFRHARLASRLREAAEEAGTEITVDGPINGSFLFWLLGGPGVNPLPPGYRCPVCRRATFFTEGNGWDVPPLECCGQPLVPDGFEIPAESAQVALEGRNDMLTIRIAESFAQQAVRELRDFYRDFTMVRFVDEAGSSRLKYVMIPNGHEVPDTDQDGIWHASSETPYRAGYQVIELLFDKTKEQIRKMREKTGVDPSREDLLSKPVLALTAAKIREEILEEGGLMLEEAELSPTSLLRLYGYMRSSHTEYNPAFESKGTKISDVFTCREEVWHLVNRAMDPDYEISSEVTRAIADRTRKGMYTGNRMKPETEQLLRGLGIDVWCIVQMKETMYLPAKGDLVVRLLELLKLTWYELRTGVYGGTNGGYCVHKGELRPSEKYRKEYRIPDHPLDDWYEEEYRVWKDEEVFLEKRICRECGKEFTLPEAMERCRKGFEHLPYLHQYRGDVCGDCAVKECGSMPVKDD